MPKITSEQLNAMAQRIVDALPEPSPEQCRRVAAILLRAPQRGESNR
jgi:hypothetical protein